jgi:hypothetical protein
MHGPNSYLCVDVKIFLFEHGWDYRRRWGWGQGSHGRGDRGSLGREMCASGVGLRNSTLRRVVHADGKGGLVADLRCCR